MKKTIFARIMLIAIIAALQTLSCTKKNNMVDDGEISLSDTNIEKKYLAEGFISEDLFRVVIVTLKDSGAAEPGSIKSRAKNRARVSLERSLAEDNIPSDRNMKAEILNIIEQNGHLFRKDIEHRRYNVYYFDVTKKNMKNYLRNISSQR
jgi:superfamily I DNA and/or RNA helicase